MLRVVVVAFSVVVYGGLAWLVVRRRSLLTAWPSDPAARRLWVAWVMFLLLLSPLAFAAGDTQVWIDAMTAAATGNLFPPLYPYLPVYAQMLGALLLPLHTLGWDTALVNLYIVRLPVVVAYVYAAQLMAEVASRERAAAPLAVVLAPVTIFYVFFGTNHIVMLTCLLAAVYLLRRGRSFSAGIFAGLGCYKFLLIPTVFVLSVISARTNGGRRTFLFVVGGLITLLPSAAYYLHDPQDFWRTLIHGGGIGGHSQHVEPFHAFYLLRDMAGFEAWYVTNRVWLWTAIAGALVSSALYVAGRLNALQSLGLSAGIVALVSVEPFRLEPTVGTLWLDAINRQDSRAQSAVLLLVFAHAAAWFYPANSRYLAFYEPAARYLNMNGALVGTALVGLLVVTLIGGSKAAKA